jgi:hypothetical protein
MSITPKATKKLAVNEDRQIKAQAQNRRAHKRN